MRGIDGVGRWGSLLILALAVACDESDPVRGRPVVVQPGAAGAGAISGMIFPDGRGGYSGTGCVGGCPRVPWLPKSTEGFTDVALFAYGLVSLCDYCGLSHETARCQDLVNSVPKASSPGAVYCRSESFDFARCVNELSLDCTVPSACADARGSLDACLKKIEGLFW